MRPGGHSVMECCRPAMPKQFGNLRVRDAVGEGVGGEGVPDCSLVRRIAKASGSSWCQTFRGPSKAIRGHIPPTWGFYPECVFEIAF